MITYFITLSLEKKVLFWENVLNFESKNLYESWTRVLWNPWFPALLERVFLTELHQIKKSYCKEGTSNSSPISSGNPVSWCTQTTCLIVCSPKHWPVKLFADDALLYGSIPIFIKNYDKKLRSSQFRMVSTSLGVMANSMLEWFQHVSSISRNVFPQEG